MTAARRSWIVTVAVVSVVAAGGLWLLVGGRGDDGAVQGLVAINSPLPSIVGESLDGTTFDSNTFRGRPTVINAWATWCAPCEQEQPALVRLADRYGDRVRFVGIDYRDDRVAAGRWVERYDVPYPSYFDPSGRTAHLLKYPLGLPDTYVVDASGVIRWAIYGRTDEQELGALIDRVLAAEASASP